MKKHRKLEGPDVKDDLVLRNPYSRKGKGEERRVLIIKRRPLLWRISLVTSNQTHPCAIKFVGEEENPSHINVGAEGELGEKGDDFPDISTTQAGRREGKGLPYAQLRQKSVVPDSADRLVRQDNLCFAS